MKIWQRLLFISTCFSLIAVAWLIGRIDSPQDCLSVDFFSHIVWQREPGYKVNYPICGKRAVKKTASIHMRDFSFLKKKLTSFENTILIFKDKIKPISLKIVEEPGLKLSVDSKKVIIGKRLLYSEGMLLKALNSVWLLQKNPSLSFSPVMLEVMSDFLLAVESGGLSITQPLSGKVAQFTKGLKENEKEDKNKSKHFCHSPWLPASQLLMCESLLKLTKNPINGEGESRLKLLYEPFSLRAQIGNTFWEKYLSIGLTRRVSSLTQFFEWMKSKDFKEVDLPKSEKEALLLSSEYAKRAFD